MYSSEIYFTWDCNTRCARVSELPTSKKCCVLYTCCINNYYTVGIEYKTPNKTPLQGQHI